MAFHPFSFSSRRSVVHSLHGVVACSQNLAAQAGIEILAKGGNAVDAAVATAAALNVTEPSSCGVGGDAFILFWDARAKRIHAANGSGRSPARLTTSYLRKVGITGTEIPLDSPHCVTVPGAPATFIDALDWWGSGKVDCESIFSPAVRLARDGYPVNEVSAFHWTEEEEFIKDQSPNGGELLMPNLKAPREGDIMRMPYLAETFKMLAKYGKDGYYKGRIAESIVKVVQDKGGLITLKDLADHRTEKVEPISYTYRSKTAPDGQPITLHEIPPNGQGITALIALGILDELEQSGKIKLDKEMQNSAEALHAMIEALRLAFADTRSYVADPSVVKVPVEELLSQEYLKKRATEFDPSQCRADLKKGSPMASSDTVYFTTSDREGNACSFIFSNYLGFGSGIVPKGCGFVLQSRGGNFTLIDGHPNNLNENPEKGKRPYHTIIPAMVTKGDELFMSYGVMGGFMQPQGHLQVLLNILHFKLNPQEALDAPRFCILPDFVNEEGKKTDDGKYISSRTLLEDGINDDVVNALANKGHNVKVIRGYGRSIFGRGQIIKRNKNANTNAFYWSAGSDPRGDGHAVPLI